MNFLNGIAKLKSVVDYQYIAESSGSDDPVDVAAELFKGAIGVGFALNPIVNNFLLFISKMTMKLPKSDAELVAMFTHFARTNKVSYTDIRGYSVYQFLPGLQITIKKDVSDNLTVRDILINDKTKLSVQNFNALIVILMRTLLSDKVFQIWNKMSDKLKIIVFQRITNVL